MSQFNCDLLIPCPSDIVRSILQIRQFGLYITTVAYTEDLNRTKSLCLYNEIKFVFVDAVKLLYKFSSNA